MRHSSNGPNPPLPVAPSPLDMPHCKTLASADGHKSHIRIRTEPSGLGPDAHGADRAGSVTPGLDASRRQRIRIRQLLHHLQRDRSAPAETGPGGQSCPRQSGWHAASTLRLRRSCVPVRTGRQPGHFSTATPRVCGSPSGKPTGAGETIRQPFRRPRATGHARSFLT